LGKDAGHLNIKGILGSLESTVEIEDLFYYNPNSITSSTVLDIPDFPQNFQATFKVKNPETTGATAWLVVGKDTNTHLFAGQVGYSGTMGIYVRVNGSYETSQVQDHVLARNTDNLITFTSNNNVHSVNYGNVTKTVTSSTITSREYVATSIGSGNYIKDLKIHEL